MDDNTQLFLKTVPHTGTHFMLGLLRKNGFMQVTHNHYGVPWREEHYPIIATIRNPVDVYITWQSRQRDWNFSTVWKLFNEDYLKQSDMFIVPVDTRDREVHLNLLGQRLSRNLMTDWQPVNSKARIECEVPDLSDIYSLDVVKAFYGGNCYYLSN